MYAARVDPLPDRARDRCEGEPLAVLGSELWDPHRDELSVLGEFLSGGVSHLVCARGVIRGVRLGVDEVDPERGEPKTRYREVETVSDA